MIQNSKGYKHWEKKVAFPVLPIDFFLSTAASGDLTYANRDMLSS